MVSMLSCFASSMNPARIDDGYLALRALGIVNAMVAVCLKLLHQQLAVYEILRAAQGNNIYLIFFIF